MSDAWANQLSHMLDQAEAEVAKLQSERDRLKAEVKDRDLALFVKSEANLNYRDRIARLEDALKKTKEEYRNQWYKSKTVKCLTIDEYDAFIAKALGPT